MFVISPSSTSRWIESSLIPSGRALSDAMPVVVLAVAEQCREFMLEAASLDRAVHAAFFRRAGLPPPSARARVRALDHRARARSASDRLVAFVVKLVVGHVVALDRSEERRV